MRNYFIQRPLYYNKTRQTFDFVESLLNDWRKLALGAAVIKAGKGHLQQGLKLEFNSAMQQSSSAYIIGFLCSFVAIRLAWVELRAGCKGAAPWASCLRCTSSIISQSRQAAVWALLLRQRLGLLSLFSPNCPQTPHLLTTFCTHIITWRDWLVTD